MTFQGADTDQLRDVATRVRMGTLRLREQQQEIMRAVQTAHWEGDDADGFRDLAMETSGRLFTVGEGLSGRADELMDHAAEQDEVSDPRDLWQRLNDLLHLPAQITRTIRNVERILTDIPRLISLITDGFPPTRDFFRLVKDFPKLAWSEYRHAMRHWDDALNGKGWEKLGGAIPKYISKYLGINLPGKEWAGKALSHLDEITDATKPWIKAGSKAFGKFLPGLDIGLGIHQIATGDDYDKVSGGLSVVSGSLMLLSPLAGPAAPIVAGVGLGIGVLSAGMDIGRTLYENVPAVKNVVDAGFKAVGDTANAIGDGLGKVGNAFGSLFG